jgi:hypothetical protein
MKTYNIEIDIQNFGEVSGWEDRYGWLNYDTLVSDGNSLEELIDNAYIYTTTQDGGTGAEFEIDSLPSDLYDYAVDAIKAKYKGE